MLTRMTLKDFGKRKTLVRKVKLVWREHGLRKVKQEEINCVSSFLASFDRLLCMYLGGDSL